MIYHLPFNYPRNIWNWFHAQSLPLLYLLKSGFCHSSDPLRTKYEE